MLPAAIAAISCSESTTTPDIRNTFPLDGISHGMIELGEKLEDPYSFDNITKALASLYPTKSERMDIHPTDLYVRFLPQSEDEYDSLLAMGYNMTDHPLDYRIIKDGDYYHDPAISSDLITWQYAVVPLDFGFPEGVVYEILDQCYIHENDRSTRSWDGVDWDAVEREAYRLTGNDTSPLTRAEALSPKGRITIVDPDANGGKPFGVAGVTVCCNSFVKFAVTKTDRDGYYEMDKTFSSNPRYRIIFKNAKGFALGINLVLLPASVSSFGEAPPSGIDINVTSADDGALFRRCVVNNATFDYYERCNEEDMDIPAPPKDLRIWIMPKLSSSSTIMMHHGAFIENSKLAKYLDGYSKIIKIFLPDMTIGTDGAKDYKTIYLSTVHELSHASHFSEVGTQYWDKFIEYIISSYISSGGTTYGSGKGENAGYCEVGEMWAYYNESKMYKERYGGIMPTFGTSYWFRPQIFRYIDDRGIGRSKIFRALKSDVTSKALLKNKLIELYPSERSMIEQVFNRYSD